MGKKEINNKRENKPIENINETIEINFKIYPQLANELVSFLESTL